MSKENRIRLAGKEHVVRELVGKGVSYREVAEILGREHGVECSYGTVARFVQEEIEERRNAAREAASKLALESVQRVMRGLNDVLVMNLATAQISFKGDAEPGAEKPIPRVNDLATATKMVDQLSRTILGITGGANGVLAARPLGTGETADDVAAAAVTASGLARVVIMVPEEEPEE